MTAGADGLQLTKVNDEVFVAAEEIVRLGASSIEFLVAQALKNKRGRARICAHKQPTAALHEMLIAMRRDTYIRPHRHRNKVESFHLVDGAADVVMLSDDGAVEDVIELSLAGSVFYRLETPRYHTVLISSPVFVVHEVTNGPFDPAETDFAGFAPEEDDAATRAYIDGLRQEASAWTAARTR